VDTHGEVQRTFDRLERLGRHYTVRVTVVPSNILRVEEIAVHLLEATRRAQIKMELASGTSHGRPFYVCGREDWRDWIDQVRAARMRATRAGRRLLSFDGAQTQEAYLQCGAWGDNMIVAGRGHVVTCFKAAHWSGSNNPFYVGTVAGLAKIAPTAQAAPSSDRGRPNVLRHLLRLRVLWWMVFAAWDDVAKMARRRSSPDATR